MSRHKPFISTDFSSENKENQHINRHRHISADSSYSTATSSEYDSDETPKKAKLTKKRPQSSHLRAQSAKQSFNGSEKKLKIRRGWQNSRIPRMRDFSRISIRINFIGTNLKKFVGGLYNMNR